MSKGGRSIFADGISFSPVSFANFLYSTNPWIVFHFVEQNINFHIVLSKVNYFQSIPGQNIYLQEKHVWIQYNIRHVDHYFTEFSILCYTNTSWWFPLVSRLRLRFHLIQFLVIVEHITNSNTFKFKFKFKTVSKYYILMSFL